ncbi:MAG: helix-turn-helix domain-containing protein [Actinomycetota bacterium]|nr:helix-turn-helix domain-containing protein [Actinomycetota bacterium]
MRTDRDREVAREVSDPKAWRALSHPIRIQLIRELAQRPSARAADLAEIIGAPANSVSFHLRQLARYGFVEPDDTAHRDQRERWWRSSSPRGFVMKGDRGQSAADRDALAKLVLVARTAAHQQLDDWFDADLAAADSEPQDQQAVSNHEVYLNLTDMEFAAFQQESRELRRRWNARDRHPSDSEDRRTYVLVSYLAPKDALDDARARRSQPG